MHTYRLHREHEIPRPIEEVFAFFSDVRNLERITPGWLNFRVLTPLPIEMRAGALIDYEIRWGPVPMRWRTEIVKWEPPVDFVDVQKRGPYKLWHHTHRFRATDDGTNMTDSVDYALPFGPLGRVAHALRVRRDLEAIFDYRNEQIDQLLGVDRTADVPR